MFFGLLNSYDWAVLRASTEVCIVAWGWSLPVDPSIYHVYLFACFYPAGPVSTVAAEDVTGVDLSEVMIESARLKYEDAKWVTGNLFSLDTLLVSQLGKQAGNLPIVPACADYRNTLYYRTS